MNLIPFPEYLSLDEIHRVNELIAREFIEQRLGITPTQQRIALLIKYIEIVETTEMVSSH